ncbi:MAG: tetratricopeptide repeat protein [Planctomycetaceae bacterium]
MSEPLKPHELLDAWLKKGGDATEWLANHPEQASVLKASLEVIGALEREMGGGFGGPITGSVFARLDPATRPPGPPALLREEAETGPPLLASQAAAEGRYVIAGEIARGGMGVVLKGYDPDLAREVAVKVLREEHADRPDVVRRFVEEAQIGGQLQHPGIAPIYEVGVNASRRPYFAMKLVRGRTLAALLQEGGGGAGGQATLVSLFSSLCQTVAYAHARGVIHRDLKPSNVMVGSFGEVLVMDWGLGKVLARGGTEDDRRSRSQAEGPVRTVRSGPGTDSDSLHGSVIGTGPYMSPEAARGDVEALDERADVFGLGAILCEILTGRPPYFGTAGEVLEKAWSADLGDAYNRLAGCGADAALVDLAKACLSATRENRPRDGSAVARAVTAYITSVAERKRAAETELARAEVRVGEERKRRRLSLALSATVLGLVVLGGGGGAVFALRAQAERTERSRRLERIAHEVAAAVREARSEGERAQSAIEDAHAWKAALASGLSAARRAEALLAQGGSDVDPALAREVAETTKKLEADERDRRLLATFEEFRSAVLLDARANRMSTQVSGDEVVEAFRDWGIEFGETPGAEVAALVASRPVAVRPLLITALHEGFTLPRTDPAKTTWWRGMLAEVDTDPWRRAILAARGPLVDATVRRLIDELDATTQQPGYLAGIAQDLPQRLAGEALHLLAKTQHAHPADFWANFSLAAALSNERRYEEAIRCYYAALAVRPRSAGVWLNLGIALRDMRRGGAEEIRAFERALALEPRYTVAWVNLGDAIWSSGRLADAIPMFRTAVECDPENAAAQHGLGRALRDGGEPDEGLARLRRAVELAPRDPLFRRTLGRNLYHSGDLHGAAVQLCEAVALGPRDWENFRTLGDVLDDLGDFLGSAAALRAAAALRPDDGGTHANLALVLRKLLDWDGAIEHARKAVDLLPNNAKVHHNLGLMCSGTFDLDGAIACQRRAIEVDPAYVAAARELAICLLRSDRASEAVEMLESVERRLAPGDPRRASLSGERYRTSARAAARLSDVLAGREEVGEGPDRLTLVEAAAARRLFRAGAKLAEAFDLDTDFADGLPWAVAWCPARSAAGEGDASDATAAERAAWRARALRALRLALDGWRVAATGPEPDRLNLRISIDLCRRDPAFAALREPRSQGLPEVEREAWRRFWSELDGVLALAWERPDPKERMDLARALWMAAQRDHALDVYREASAYNPTAPEPPFWVGSTLFEAGHAEEALPHLQRAVDLAPQAVDSRLGLARALMAAGELESAAAQLREALALDPKNVVARNDLGHCLGECGDFEGSVDAYREAAALAPDHPVLMNNLGLALLFTLELDEALKLLRRAETLRPDEQNVQWNLGLVLDCRLDLDGAIAAYRKCVALPPTFARAARRLARALVQHGQVAEAVDVLEKAWLAIDAGDVSAREEVAELRDRYRRVLKAAETLAAATAAPIDELDTDERFALAEAAGAKRLFRTAAQLAAKAFEPGAAWLAIPDYQVQTLAIRCAVLAGTGAGEDATLSASERAAWRSRAVEWLRTWVEHSTPRARVATTMERRDLRWQIDVWRRSPDFAAVRDPGLSALPSGEQAEWRRAWAEVEEVFELASAWPR